MSEIQQAATNLEIFWEKREVFCRLEIPGLDDIRGNISLPDQIEGAAVSWKSSDPSVISDKKQGEKAAGVVSRGSTDKQVTLTAVITKGAASTEKIFHATVKKAPQKLLEDDFTAYLFGSFTGTEGSPMDEQIYFAVSTDGILLHGSESLQAGSGKSHW